MTVPDNRYKILMGLGFGETKTARLKHLETLVNTHIDEGWHPIGGVSWAGDLPTQAMLHPGYTIVLESGGPNA